MQVSMLIAQTIAFLPLSRLRCSAYRLLLKYKIDRKAQIGFGTFIAVDQASIGNCVIAKFNRFSGPMTITIGDDVRIGAKNRFDCGSWAASHPSSGLPYARSLYIDNAAVITGQHLFDVVGGLHIGKRTWIAGAASQFWTHGAGANERDIRIGDDCYIGSAVRFTPGAEISDGSQVGVGSVVTKSFQELNALIAGVPARWIKNAESWQAQRSNQRPPP